MKQDIGASFADSIRLICKKNEGNMNTLLNPEVVDYDEERQVSTLRYKTQRCFMNQRGQIHGGAISAMFDVAMGVTIAVYNDRDVTTAEMSISYIRPFIGEAFDFKTEIIYFGKKLARAQCKAYNVETGKLCATSHSTFAYIEQRVSD